MKKITHFFFSIIVFQLFFSSTVYADPSATISLNPENPEPKSNVALTLESYSFNVNTAIITWKINDVTIRKGEGEKTFSLRTGNVGEVSHVTVTAETSDGSLIEQTIDVVPSSVILLFEAPKSYVPVLYEGRSLPSDGGLVRVTALPQISDNGVPILPSSLSYSWYLNDSILKSLSGVGKQSATIRLDYLKNKNDIKVIVRSPFGNSGTKKIVVYPHAIMPLLYTYDPTLGTNFTTLIERRFEATSDFTLSLEPFYLSQKEQKDPTFTWYIDGLPATPFGGRLLSLHPKENSYGTKMVTIKVSGPDKRIQKAETQLEIIYDTRK
jgi:hypothetical protein